jgi:eukaryotic-like serine/threonine-protein kinase
VFNAPAIEVVREAFPDREILSYIGKGSFKAVYELRAEEPEALKLFHVPEFEDSEEGQESRKSFLGRFQREIRLLARCETPSLVKLGQIEPFEVSVGGVAFIAYSEQRLNGVSLRELITAHYQPAELEVRALVRSLVAAITELWERFTCVHRDIKPENVMKIAGSDIDFVLLDLGVSFQQDGTRFTAAGLSPGTPLYRAPEMLEVDYADKLDARTDLYCAGVCAFEFAAGVHPLAPFNTGSIEGKILNQPPASLATLRPDLSEELCEIIDRLNRKNISLRGNLELIRGELGM